jgi:hypothetical protein
VEFRELLGSCIYKKVLEGGALGEYLESSPPLHHTLSYEVLLFGLLSDKNRVWFILNQ